MLAKLNVEKGVGKGITKIMLSEKVSCEEGNI